MICPKCDYMMDAFDKECVRCHGKGIAPKPAPVAPAPVTTDVPAPKPIPQAAPPVVVLDEDKPSFLLDILGIFLPIVGFILYFVLKDSKPVQAKSVGLWSLGGVLMYFLFNGFVGIPQINPFAGLGGVSTTELQDTVREGYNEELAKSGDGVTCLSVSLAKETDHVYTGFAELSDGTKPPVKVTVGDDGQIIWKAGLMALG